MISGKNPQCLIKPVGRIMMGIWVFHRLQESFQKTLNNEKGKKCDFTVHSKHNLMQEIRVNTPIMGQTTVTYVPPDNHALRRRQCQICGFLSKTYNLNLRANKHQTNSNWETFNNNNNNKKTKTGLDFL